MNISCRIANADTQCGRITNPPERENAIYAPGGAANTGIFPVNINSTRDDIIQSYPWNATHLRGLPSNIRLVPGLYYKR